MNKAKTATSIEGLVGRWRRSNETSFTSSRTADGDHSGLWARMEGVREAEQSYMEDEGKIKSARSDLQRVIEMTRTTVLDVRTDIDKMRLRLQDIEEDITETNNKVVDVRSKQDELREQGITTVHSVAISTEITMETEKKQREEVTRAKKEGQKQFDVLRSICYMQERRIAELELVEKQIKGSNVFSSKEAQMLVRQLRRDIESETYRTESLNKRINNLVRFQIDLPSAQTHVCDDQEGDAMEWGLKYDTLCFQIRKYLRGRERSKFIIVPSADTIALLRAKKREEELWQMVESLERQRQQLAVKQEEERRSALFSQEVDHKTVDVVAAEASAKMEFLFDQVKQCLADCLGEVNKSSELVDRIKGQYLIAQNVIDGTSLPADIKNKGEMTDSSSSGRVAIGLVGELNELVTPIGFSDGSQQLHSAMGDNSSRASRNMVKSSDERDHITSHTTTTNKATASIQRNPLQNKIRAGQMPTSITLGDLTTSNPTPSNGTHVVHTGKPPSLSERLRLK